MLICNDENISEVKPFILSFQELSVIVCTLLISALFYMQVVLMPD